MPLVGSIIGGIIGGAIGAAIWAAVSYTTNYEVTYIAILVGVLAGLGVRLAGSLELNRMAGVIAVVIAILSVVAGKYAAVSLNTNDIFFGEQFYISEIADTVIEEWRDAGQNVRDPIFNPNSSTYEEDYPPRVWIEAKKRWDALADWERKDIQDNPTIANPHYVIVSIADQIIEEMDDEGESLDWPPGKSYMDAWWPSHYPSTVIEDANRRWNAMSTQEQDEYDEWVQSEDKRFNEMFEEVTTELALEESFSAFDLIWFGLAAVCAWGTALGGTGE